MRNRIPGNGNIRCIAFCKGNRIHCHLRGSKQAVAAGGIQTPCELGEGNGAGCVQVNGAFTGNLGDDNLLDIALGRSHHTALDSVAVVVEQGNNHGGCAAIGNEQIHGAGSIHLEGEIALGGNALLG